MSWGHLIDVKILDSRTASVIGHALSAAEVGDAAIEETLDNVGEADLAEAVLDSDRDESRLGSLREV